MQEIISIEARTLDRMLKKITTLYGLQNIYTADSAKSIFFWGGGGKWLDNQEPYIKQILDILLLHTSWTNYKKVCKENPSIPHQTPNTMKKTTSLTTF